MLGTSALRTAWSPACRSGHHLLQMYVGIDAALKKWGYQPHAGTGAANCRPITGGTGYSLHSYFGDAPFTFWNGYRIPLMALALDVNPQQNPYGPRLVTDMPRGMIDDLTRIRTKNGQQLIGWGGYFTPNHDAMHLQGVCTPTDMATGIDPATLPHLAQTPTPNLPEDDDMPGIIIVTSTGTSKTYGARIDRMLSGSIFPPCDGKTLDALKKANVPTVPFEPDDYDETLRWARLAVNET